MAKKKKSDAANTSNSSNKSKDKKKKKGKALPILIVMFLLIGGAIAGIIIFNPLDIRDTFLVNIPIIGDLVPSPEVLEEREAARTNAQLQEELLELNAQMEILTQDLTQARSMNQMYQQEISTLRGLEDQQIEFRQNQAEFDRMIAEGDPDAFLRFFEAMSPENAEAMYRELIVREARTEELNDFIQTVTSMENDAAARMLEVMISSEMDLVALILRNIAANRRGAILEEMSSVNAAGVLPYLAPE